MWLQHRLCTMKVILCFVSLVLVITMNKKVSCTETTTSSSISVEDQCNTLVVATNEIWYVQLQGFNNFSMFAENATSQREHFCNASSLLGQIFKICSLSYTTGFLIHKGLADWGCTEDGYADLVALQSCLQHENFRSSVGDCQSRPSEDECMYPTSMSSCLTEYADKYCKPGDKARVYNSVKSILSTVEAFFCKSNETNTTTSTPTASATTASSFTTTSPQKTSDSVTTGRTTTTSFVTTQETTSKPNDTLTTRTVNDATTTYPYTTTISASTNAAATTVTTQPSVTPVRTTTSNQPTITQAVPNVECYKCNSGCNIKKPNRNCPANGKMRISTPTIKCTGPCISFVNTTNVIRGCSDGAFPDLTIKPTNKCLTHNLISMCFCTGDRCNTRSMEKGVV